MPNQFRICNKCKAMNIDSIIPRLKEIDDKAEIVVGCQNFCGIGQTKAFVIVNHVPVIAENEDELINKIKDKISD